MAAFKVSLRRIVSGRGVFKLHDTHGFPLELSALLACERHVVIDWSEFIESARKAGWKMTGLVDRIKDACRDAGYNTEVMEAIGEN